MSLFEKKQFIQQEIRLMQEKLKSLLVESAVVDKEIEDLNASNSFTEAEIEQLIVLNQSLENIDQYLYEVSRDLNQKFLNRLTDPTDLLEDYEIEAKLHFILKEDDPAFDEENDNFLTSRSFSIKELGEEPIHEGDWRETCREFPGRLNEVPHSRLFHDLYDHSYNLDQLSLSFRDCLRIGQIWVRIIIEDQSTFVLSSS
jgi:hypothetical protein